MYRLTLRRRLRVQPIDYDEELKELCQRQGKALPELFKVNSDTELPVPVEVTPNTTNATCPNDTDDNKRTLNMEQEHIEEMWRVREQENTEVERIEKFQKLMTSCDALQEDLDKINQELKRLSTNYRDFKMKLPQETILVPGEERQQTRRHVISTQLKLDDQVSESEKPPKKKEGYGTMFRNDIRIVFKGLSSVNDM